MFAGSIVRKGNIWRMVGKEGPKYRR